MADTNSNGTRAPDDSDTNETRQGKVKRGKARDAFAFRDFDETRILQRKFFADKGFVNKALKGTLFHDSEITLSDENILKLCFGIENRSVYVYDDCYQNIKLGVGYLQTYCDRVRKHVRKLDVYLRMLADKILTSDVPKQQMKKRYLRARSIADKYTKVLAALYNLVENMEITCEAINADVCKEYRKLFASRLKGAREDREHKKERITQAKLASMLDITDSAYLYYEKGRREPSLATLIRLAKALNVTPNWLLGFE